MYIENIVSVVKKENIGYPTKKFTFRPSIEHPEYLYKEYLSKEKNDVYELVRESMFQIGLDKENYNTKKWNPLGNYIKPGYTVLLKPNLVHEENREHQHSECLYTHPSVVAAIIDYVCIALKNKGKIIVGDAPVQSCDFEKLITQSGYDKMINFYKDKGIDISLIDFRGTKSVIENNVPKWNNVKDRQKKIKNIDLSKGSFFNDLSKESIDNMRITNYAPNELRKYHGVDKHIYSIAEEAIISDVIINICKPKTHRKAGITISLKNFVGLISKKECLPHHRNGAVAHGNDEYKNDSAILKLRGSFLDIKNSFALHRHYYLSMFFDNLARVLSMTARHIGKKESIREGSWYGNDTIWRTILDINNIILNTDKNGQFNNKKFKRKVLCFADMIYVGEKEGPLFPTPKYGGMIVFGDNLLSFDKIVATLMGIDFSKIPTICNAEYNAERLFHSLNNTYIVSNNPKWNMKTYEEISSLDTLNVEPTEGWKNHCELRKKNGK